MGLPGFHIEIVTQGWLGPDPEDAEAAAYDLCSHGDIRLVIGGETIAAGDDGEYGISEAALGLLRTITSNRTRSPVTLPDSWPGHGTAEVAQKFERLIPHGCGLILMMNCPIGIDWTVEHLNGRVRISEVFRSDDVGPTVREYPGVAAEVPLQDYRDEIVAFARRAKEPFEGITKSISDDFDREMYVEFWKEYDRRLADAVGASEP